MLSRALAWRPRLSRRSAQSKVDRWEEEHDDDDDDDGGDAQLGVEMGREEVVVEEAEEQEEEDERRHVPLMVHVALEMPLTFIVAVLVVGGLASMFVIPFFDLTDPLAGIRIRDSVVAQWSDGWIKAKEDIDKFWKDQEGGVERVRQALQSQSNQCLTLLYMTDADDNIFTPNRLERIRQVEEGIQSLPGFFDHCQKNANTGLCEPLSTVLRRLGPDNVDTQAKINARLEDLWVNETDSMRMFLRKEFFEPLPNGQPNLRSSMTRTFMCLGLPLEGYANDQVAFEEQRELRAQWISQPGGMADFLEAQWQDKSLGMEVLFWQDHLNEERTKAILAGDTLNCVAAIFVILTVMVLHMRSVFLGVFALFQVLLSFPVAFFIYRILLGIELFGGLQCIAIFVVLGIGADDCFIAVDSFKQSLPLDGVPGWGLAQRVSFGFKRAQFTMLVTTMTTGFAFLMLTISKIPTVRYFGIFASLLIVTNFLLVTSLYTCVLVLWERHFRLREASCWARICPGPRQQHGLSASERKLGASPGSPWLARVQRTAKGTIGEAVPRGDGDAHSEDSSSTRASRRSIALEKVLGPSNNIEEFNWASRFITNKRHARIIVGAFAVLVAVMLGFSTQLRTASDEQPFWGPGQFYYILQKSVPDVFHDGVDNGVRFATVYGLEAPFIDRSGTKETIPEDLGEPIYNLELDVADPAAQQALVEDCSFVFTTAKDIKAVRQDRALCTLNAFAKYRIARNESFPVPPPVPGTLVINVSAPTEAFFLEETFEDALLEFLGRPQFEVFQQAISFDLLNGANNTRPRLNCLFNSFVAQTDYDVAYRDRRDLNDAWTAFFQEEVRPDQPATLGNPDEVFWTAFDYFVIMETQILFLINSFTSLGLSTLLTLFFLLLATNNWKLSSLAGITVLGIVVVVLGSIAVIGWELDTIISVAITILVGFAVDYTLHAAVAYDEAFRERGIVGRDAKVNHLFRTMTVSIAAGALSTFGAAMMLLPAELRFFRQFGGFLGLAVGVALSFALVFFPAMLSLLGPEANSGVVHLPHRCRRKRRIGLYDLEYHTPRPPRTIRAVVHASQASLVLALLVVVLWNGKFTGNYLFTIPVPAPPAAQLVWEDVGLPALVDLEPGEWHRIRPGRDTVCAGGSEFAFFFKPGTSDNATLIIEWEDGGVCWNLETCRADARIIRSNVDLAQVKFEDIRRGETQAEGLADPEGPFADAHHLFIPLCTADYHWGNKSVTYGGLVDVEHRGAINVIRTLEWILGNSFDLELASIVSTGTGSGAYGALVYVNVLAAWLQVTGLDQSVRLVHHGDAGAGVFAPDFLAEITDKWGINIEQTDVILEIAGQNLTVPIFELQPDDLEDLFDVINSSNLTEVNDCLLANNATANTTELVQDLADFFFNGQASPVIEACVNTSAFDLNITDLIAGTGTDNITAGIPGFGTTVPTVIFDAQGNVVLWEDFVEDNCLNTTASELLNTTIPFNLTLAESVCANFTTVPTNLTLDFVPEDFADVVQLVPSLLLVAALRFPQHSFSSYFTAYDYSATRSLVMQVLGRDPGGVTINEQALFFEAVTTIYDLFLPLFPPNYLHYMDSGDLHGQVGLDRHYRALEGLLFQILVVVSKMATDPGTFGLPLRADCRDSANCLDHVDVRSTPEYI